MKRSALEIADVERLPEAGKLIPGWKSAVGEGAYCEPNREEIDPDIQKRRIVEFYSR